MSSPVPSPTADVEEFVAQAQSPVKLSTPALSGRGEHREPPDRCNAELGSVVSEP